MTHKQAAIDFLQMIVARKIKEAYAKHVSPKFIHHNAWFPSDAQSLMNGMIEAHTKFPNTKLDIKHALEDGDFVAVHSHVVMQPKDPGMAVVHLFRFENDKIVEMWDVGQQIPKDQVNEKGMF